MFAGIYCHQVYIDPALSKNFIEALNPHQKADLIGSWRQDALLLVQASVCNTPESHREQVPYRCPVSGLTIVCWVRLDNREELLVSLKLSTDSTDPQLIIAAFRLWGEDCVKHLVGDYAFAIADPAKSYLFLARDPLGARPLYYYSTAHSFVFASSAAVFLTLINKPEPDPDWIARYLVSRQPADYTATAYKGVLKLAPGHCLTVTPGQENLRRYFFFKDDAPVVAQRSQAWVDAFKAQLEQAVRCRLRSDYPIGCENSGGLDSAAITGFSARLIERPSSNLHCFGNAQRTLEPEYILETSRYHSIANNHINTATDEIHEDVLVRCLQTVGYPAEQGCCFVYFLQLGEMLGIRTLLSGTGGDQTVTEHGRHFRSQLLLDRQYRALWQNLPGNPVIRTLRYAKTLLRYWRPSEFHANIHNAWIERLPYFIVQDAVMDRLKLAEYCIDFTRFDVPYRRINDFILQHEISPSLTQNLENNSLMAQSYGIEYRWPMLDTRLIQQYLSTPAIEKASGEWNRYLHRRAIEGIVPAKVQWKASKHMGGNKNPTPLPIHIQWAKEEESRLHPIIAELINREKFREQIKLAEQGHAGRGFYWQFTQDAIKIRWLNRWLHHYKL